MKRESWISTSGEYSSTLQSVLGVYGVPQAEVGHHSCPKLDPHLQRLVGDLPELEASGLWHVKNVALKHEVVYYSTSELRIFCCYKTSCWDHRTALGLGLIIFKV